MGETEHGDVVFGFKNVLQQWFEPDWYDSKTNEPEPHGWRDVPVEEE